MLSVNTLFHLNMYDDNNEKKKKKQTTHIECFQDDSLKAYFFFDSA